MENLSPGQATICVVNYKTPELIRLCLRSIRKFTHSPYRVVVVDNDSQDKSLEYLQSLSWIQLVSRRFGAEKILGSDAEGSGLNLGFQECTSEFYVAMHSDTIIQKDNWLAELLKYFQTGPNVACVGSDKLETKARWRVLLKKATDVKALGRRLFGDPRRRGWYRPHNRTICCLYRTEVLRREKLSFLSKDRILTAGQGLYFDLLDRGYGTVELPASVLSRYVIHLNHATMVLNPQEFTCRKRSVQKYQSKVTQVMSSPLITDLQRDSSLDR
jgi:glycosyltransferase involved in cell wall biosynthesis